MEVYFYEFKTPEVHIRKNMINCLVSYWVVLMRDLWILYGLVLKKADFGIQMPGSEQMWGLEHSISASLLGFNLLWAYWKNYMRCVL